MALISNISQINVSTYIVFVIGCIPVLLAVRLILALYLWRRLIKRELVTVELSPPAHVTRSMQATQELFSVLHGMQGARRIRNKILKREIVMSFEVVSTNSAGIQFLVHIQKDLANSFQQAVSAYMSGIRVTERPYRSTHANKAISFKQTSHYAFPLASNLDPDQHDPVAYLTNAMTKLRSDEQMLLQYVITPVRLKEAGILARRILGNEDLLTRLSTRGNSIFTNLFGGISHLLLGATETLGGMYHGATKLSYQSTDNRQAQEKHQIAKRMRPARTLSAFELELMESIHRKVNQPLFRVSVRATITSANTASARERLTAIRTSLATYDMSG